ncbi:MAG: sigma-70 family RNA polymerase sigma factor [Flavobacterium sp.]|nr:MAG: sigma-70 family RNA polymerase sigma factor [Flavobacterium sp.]
MPAGEALEKLISGCKRSDRESQKEFYRFFYGYAMAICFRYCPNQEDAMEVVNDGFLKIFRGLDSFTPQYGNTEVSIKAWIKRIMVNVSIDHCRKHAKMFSVKELQNHHLDAHVETSNSIDQLSFREILALVEKLSPTYRTIFNMFVIDGYKHEEISKCLDISVGTSKSNLAKARMNIQKLLKEAAPYYYEQRAI